MRWARHVGALTGLVVAAGVGVGPAAEVVASPDRVPTQIVTSCPDAVDPVELTSVAQVEQLLVGTWIRCTDDFLVPPTGGPAHVGLEFAADGRFYRLYEGDLGGLIRVEGLEQEGDWKLFDDLMGSYQLDARVLGGGTSITVPMFFGEPSLVQMPHLGGATAFVPWTGDPTVLGVPAGVGDGPCGLPAGPVELTSVAEVEQLLVGTWVRCGETSVLGPVLPGEVGLDILADGRFFRLYDDSQGGLTRGDGPGQEGRWEVIDNTVMNGPGSYQVNLTVEGVGTFHAPAVVLERPVHLRLGEFPPADYRRPLDQLPPTGANLLAALVALGSVAGGFVLVRASRRASTW